MGSHDDALLSDGGQEAVLHGKFGQPQLGCVAQLRYSVCALWWIFLSWSIGFHH